jgi:hypothetical protein
LGLKYGLRPAPVYFLASSSDEEEHEVDFFTPIEEFSSSSPPEIWVLIWQGRDSTTLSWELDTGTRMTPKSIFKKNQNLGGGKYSIWMEQLRAGKTT